MTSRERTDSPTGAGSTAGTAVCRDQDETADLRVEIEALKLRLAQAEERESATSEILRTISSSPTELQSVLDAVAESASRLCNANDATIFRVEGDALWTAAHYGSIPVLAVDERFAIRRDIVTGRAILERRTFHVADVPAEPDSEWGGSKAFAARLGYRTFLAAPMLRHGKAIGVIALRRVDAQPFSEKQIKLLETFADQAVIAIENTRLFTELQERLEQQTATSEILRVISQSLRDVQPVFQAIAANARSLCEATASAVSTFDGEVIHHAAGEGYSPEAVEAIRATHPRAPSHAGAVGRAVLTRAVVYIPEVGEDAQYPLFLQSVAQTAGFRSVVAVPMLRDDSPIGAISVVGSKPAMFTERQIAMLQTFADQAVIAIENTRLFNELQERNKALTEALEQQTATSEILRVISRSPTDLQPVLDAVAERASKLCGAIDAQVVLVSGQKLPRVAGYGSMPMVSAMEPLPITRGIVAGRAVLDKKTVHLHDAASPEVLADFEELQPYQARFNFRTVLATPLMREDTAIGAIIIRRMEVNPFSERQVQLIQTFADQAVIAIENVRLFTALRARTQELARSVEQMRSLADVGQVVNSTLDLERVLTTVLEHAVLLSSAEAGVLYERDEATAQLQPRAVIGYSVEIAEALSCNAVKLAEGVVARAAAARAPVEMADLAADSSSAELERHDPNYGGFRSVLAVPLLREHRVVGGLAVSRKRSGSFLPEVVELLETFAAQSTLAIQNARLFREVERKGRELEAASQHKSQFLANMSHELRTPLNAIIGFSEVLEAQMFGELNEKQVDYMRDIHSSGQHLLSLINDILDLSKIEAGHMELSPGEFDLPAAVENAGYAG
jgi:GAF domain-containing protein